MPIFEYEGETEDGRSVNDTIEAPSRAVAVLRVRKKGISISAIDSGESRSGAAEQAEAARGSQVGQRWMWWYGLNTVSAGNMANFFDQLSVLYRAGIGTYEIISDLSEAISSGRLRGALQSCVPHLQEGYGLSDCLRRYPQIFPAGIVGMVKVGELTGNLDEVAELLADDYDGERKVWLMTLLPKLYLTVVFALAMLVSSFPMIVGEPNIIAGLRVWARYALVHIFPWFIVAILAYLGFRIAWYTASVVRLRDRLSYNMPVWSTLTRRIGLYRFYTSLEIAVSAGIDFPIAWEAAAEAAGNPYLVRDIKDAAEQMHSGADVRQALADCELLSAENRERMASAADTGTFDEALPTMASEAEQARTSFVRAVRIGGVVAGYAIASIIALVALVLGYKTFYNIIFERASLGDAY